MSNILEYLDWRGDISFEVSPFNEVDNLILAEICYTDFEGVMTQDDTLSVVDASRIYFEIHTEEEIRSRDTFYKLAPLVLKKAAESERFKGMILKNYINLISASREEQYSAITFVLPNGLTYVAFRGTDNTIVGWREDFNLSFMNETAGQRRAVEYINYYFGESGTNKSSDGDNTLSEKNLILGGHSKGGNFAVYAAAFCEPEIQKNILKVYSNDGPGFRDEILETDSYKNILPRIVSILPEESMVGILLSNEYDNKIVKSDSHGIGQHDPLNWQVYGTEFVEAAKRAEISKVIDKTMMEWLSEMSDEDRAVFTESVFSTLDTTGAKTLSELSDGGVKIISEILRSIKEMPAEKQTELSVMVKRLIKIGSDIAVAELKDKAKHVKKSLPKANIPSLPGSTSLVPENVKSGKARTVGRNSAQKRQKNISDERIKEEKNKLRREIYDIRKSMVDTEMIQKSFAICKKLMSMNIYKDSDIVLAYMSIDNEVDLSYLISKAVEEGKKVYIPKVRTKTKMDFYLYDGSFNIGKYGIREPASKVKFDPAELLTAEEQKKVLLIMPGVVFDKSRNRIGHGGGFYDRYLDSVNRISYSSGEDESGQEKTEKNGRASEYIFKAAVCYDYQVKASVPHDRRDKRVDTIITETKVL